MCTVVLDFYSETCNPCKRLSLDLDEISEGLGIEIKKLDIMENYDLTEKYNIRSVPTLIVLKDEESKASYIGYKGKEDLKKFIYENI